MKSTTNYSFSKVPQAEIPRSSFDRSSGYKTTIDAGGLYPFFVDEVVPGDTFNLKSHALARLATPLHPTMDNMFLETFYFFVPNRLTWDNWERFQGQQDSPGDSIDYLIPQQTSDVGFGEGSLADYFGLPIDVGPISVSALPFRAYRRIYNEWFRDQNLQNIRVFETDDGPDTNILSILPRGKRHDYFTSCLPSPQKGESVPLPLGTSAPVVPDGNNTSIAYADAIDAFGTVRNPDGTMNGGAGGDGTSFTYFGGATGLEADLTDATAATINELRQAFQIQRMLERDMRSGTRYVESIKAHFGVTSPDFRLQRSEYLGGGSTPINISTVHNTAADPATTLSPLGELAGIGTGIINGHGFTKSFTEHGFIIGLINCRADLTYQNQINRLWSRETRYDHYYPALSRLGEQAVLNKEIYAQGTAADDDVFGYQEIYAEMRYKPSLVTNRMRSASALTLDSWHLAQDFLTLPTLSSQFIEDNPPIDRTIAVPDEPHFIIDVYHKLTCARPMPTYGTPGMIDHF